MLLLGCSTPPPPSQPQSPPPVQPSAPEVVIDDIPSDVPPQIRAHLIKLREMRDRGQISLGDYESRKVLLLQSQ